MNNRNDYTESGPHFRYSREDKIRKAVFLLTAQFFMQTKCEDKIAFLYDLYSFFLFFFNPAFNAFY